MGVEDPVVIVGGGLSGAASAWALTRRGVPVVLIEQFAAGHPHGSSHGSARIARRAYGDALYVGLTGAAFDLWAELEATAGVALLRMIGGLDHGPGRDVGSIAAHLQDAGVPHELLSATEVADRWPGMVVDGSGGAALFHPQAGTVDADAAVAAMLRLAGAGGAQLRTSTTVTRVAAGSSTGPAAELADGSTIRARAVVVAAGGWVAGLLGGMVDLPPLHVTRQTVVHLSRRDPTAPPWPSVIHELGGGHAVYHLAGGRDGGPLDDRKIGVHDPGPTAAPGSPGTPDPTALARLENYVSRWLPGLDPLPRSVSTCLYTSTPSEDFVLDRLGDLVVCSPCSGHGAKFAPLVGELVADLVTGTDRPAVPVPDRFRLAQHLAGRSVSAVSL